MTVYIDHKNLEYFMSTCVLNWCQARWNMSLSRFDFGIVHQPAKQQGLSIRSNLIPKEGEAAYDHMIFQLLNILDSTRPWSLFLGTSGGLKCGKP